ncbi:tryptophan-specific transport protein, partial [Haemophilus influenzae HK1212]
MTQQRSPSLLGGAMIIAGTAIGAGMLANPTSTAGVWFIGSILVLHFCRQYLVQNKVDLP